MPDWFRLDRTEGQEHALYVAAEKDTLRQQLTGWLADAGVPVLGVRGFGSQSYADVVHDRVTADPRGAVLLVVGDFDCSSPSRARRTPGSSARPPTRAGTCGRTRGCC